ncbi:MAG: PBP1A family penicillin-binding protein [Gammaproteobacteria bacterium AqS3]|nr:PBP1A family penicillin-binding protein [Gammaproteobacteria bacterium AqS3]
MFRKLFKWFLALGFMGGGLAGVLLSGAALYFHPGLPSVDVLRTAQLQIPLRIYTRDGLLIGSFGEKRRRELTYREIPPQFVEALLSAEDDRFLQHFGVDLLGLMRASYELARFGRIRSGGSTITMQVARNYLLTRERSFARKFREILLSLKIETELTKEQILELYVNQIFLGHRAYGIASGAEVYYGRDISELPLEQLAMLAGLPKAPSAVNPITNPERAKIRRDWILKRMHLLGFISERQMRRARNTSVVARYHRPRTEVEASHTAEQVRQQVLGLISTSAYTDGYAVYTTLDSRMQEAAVEAVASGLNDYDRRHGLRELPNHLDQLSPEIIEYLLPGDVLQTLAPVEWPGGEDEAAEVEAAEILPFLAGPRPLDEELDEELDDDAPEGLNALVDLLYSQPVPRDVEPALLLGIDVQGQLVHLMLPDRSTALLKWDAERYAWAKPAQDINTLGPQPQHFADMLRVGDLIEVQRGGDGEWSLVQTPEAQAALVSLDSRNGAIRALVGGLDYSRSSYNRVYQARPQMGSNIKPFIYSAALARGFTAASVINDAPVVFKDDALEKLWRPVNSSGVFHGPTRLREALLNSRNLVSVRLLREIGIPYAVKFLDNFGIDTRDIPRNLSVALGSSGASPLEMARGYAVFANGGHLVNPHLIERIEDLSGRIVWQPLPVTACADDCPDEEAGQPDFAGAPGIDGEPLPLPGQQPPPAPRVLDGRIAYILWDFLHDAVQRGTARRARSLERQDIAGKTATTNDATDTWFTGFNPKLVTTVWMGHDTPRTLGSNEWGNTTSLPIWMDYTAKALENMPDEPPDQPPDLVRLRIDAATGKRAVAGDRNVRLEWFRSEYAPAAEEPGREFAGGRRMTLEDLFESLE